MGRKFDIRICSCGRIHFVENKDIDDAVSINNELMVICGRCGDATIVGAEILPDLDDPRKSSYHMYSHTFKGDDFQLTKDKFKVNNKPLYKVIYSSGKGVPMKTGNNANSYSYGIFSDMMYTDFYKIQRSDITVEEIMKFISDWESNHQSVDMHRLVNELSDTECEELSSYGISGFDWSCTKYAK